MTTVYLDERGNPVYGIKSREHFDRENQADIQRYGGKPTYTTSQGEVPTLMREEEEYRVNPETERYMVFDKQKGEFVKKPGERGGNFDLPQTRKEVSPVATPSREESGMQVLPTMNRSGDERWDIGSPEVMQPRSAGPQPVAKPKMSGDQAVKTANKIKEAKDFLKVLGNREKSKSKYKK